MFVGAVNPTLARTVCQRMDVPRLQAEGGLSGESSSSLCSKLRRPRRRSFGEFTPARPDEKQNRMRPLPDAREIFRRCHPSDFCFGKSVSNGVCPRRLYGFMGAESCSVARLH